ncbi:DUF6541 family protein [Adlercreutzia sp. ZJ242]|uniref:DUF6541 family protein n=1 Tax=Adlercreutzia sp. ZJ242 TaxID=2709409 RepID=UPI00351ACEDE
MSSLGAWGLFAGCVLLEAASLWVPGYLLIRSMRVSRLTALACAPVASVALFGALGIVYAKLGVFASWASVGVLATAACALMFALSRPWRAPARLVCAVEVAGAPRCLRERFDAKCLALYVGAGLVVTTWFTVLSLSSPEGFTQSFDSMHHLGMIRTFAETGCWSSLDVATYAPEVRATTMPIAGWSFYPTAWHVAAALSASALGAPVAVAANATNFLFAGLVYPAGAFALLRCVFRDNPRALLCGAFAALAFAAFPWQMVNWGPLYPNLAAFALMPSVICFFMAIFAEGAARGERVAAAGLFAAGIVALALAQPNAVFTAAVFLIPYCVQLARRVPRLLGEGRDTRRSRNLASLVAVACIVAIWCALFSLPFLREVVWHVWPAYASPQTALGNLLLLSYRETLPQVLLGVLVLAGAAQAWRDRRYTWILCAYALMGGIYVVTLATDGLAKQLLAGFWYTDAARLGSSLAFYAVPLASLGLARAAHAAASARVVGAAGGRAPAAAACACVLAFAVVSFCPLGEGPVRTAFGDLAHSTRVAYDPTADNILSPEERAFAQEAAAITRGDLVLNMPDDGSEYAYALCGMNTYYRYNGPYGKGDETPESRLIREQLRGIATEPDVRDAVDAVGATYLLLLDQGDPKLERSRHLFTFEWQQWQGVSAISDNTPGFEPVLAEGDMRLYRITS